MLILLLILDTPKKKEDFITFFNQVRKDFIRPYGLPHDAMSFEESTLKRRLSNINCEFYLRPQIAMSEFAETVSANLKYMENNYEILDPESIKAILKKTKKIEKYLAVLESKKTGETGKSVSHKFY